MGWTDHAAPLPVGNAAKRSNWLNFCMGVLFPGRSMSYKQEKSNQKTLNGNIPVLSCYCRH